MQSTTCKRKVWLKLMIGYAKENYQIPVSQLKGVRYMQAAKMTVPKIAHHATAPHGVDCIIYL